MRIRDPGWKKYGSGIWVNRNTGLKLSFCLCSRYEVNPKYVPDFEAAGLKFVGRDVDNERMEVRARIFKLLRTPSIPQN
jgi:hypothetical protein